jgi:D-amino-acid dehydrogenase
MGIRPTLPDSLPIIDLHPKHTNIGMVFGHHHLGVTQAAISAQLITDMLSKGSPSPNTRAYSVSRFL